MWCDLANKKKSEHCTVLEKVAHFRNRCFLLVKRQKKVNRTKKAELRPKFRWENPILSFFFSEDKYGYKEAKIPSINSILKTALLPDLSKKINLKVYSMKILVCRAHLMY